MSDKTFLCRLCGKNELSICNLDNPSIKQLLTMAPNLVDLRDRSLPVSVCIDCYKMVKQINHKLSSIVDTQAILKVRLQQVKNKPLTGSQLKIKIDKESMESIMSKYKNLMVKMVPRSSVVAPVEAPRNDMICNVVQEADEEEGEFEDDGESQEDQSEMYEVVGELEFLMPDKHKSTAVKGTKSKTIVLELPSSYVCILCRTSCPTYRELEAHILNSAACRLIQLTCVVCKKQCASKKALYTHGLSHREKQHFGCNDCGKTYTNAFNLDNHRAVRHRATDAFACVFRCCDCDGSFATSEDLLKHTKIHLTEPKPHLCDACGKGFRYKEALRSHTKTHACVRSFKCVACDKSFGNRVQLAQHSHTHTGIKAYKCTECSKGFVKKDSLRHHMTQHRSVIVEEVPQP